MRHLQRMECLSTGEVGEVLGGLLGVAATLSSCESLVQLPVFCGYAT